MAKPRHIDEFLWQPEPAGQRVVNQAIDAFLGECAVARTLAERMLTETGTRFVDWVDHVISPRNVNLETRLIEADFSVVRSDDLSIFRHEKAIFPAFVIGDVDFHQLAIKVESVADFLAAHSVQAEVEGRIFGRMRRACVCQDTRAKLWVVERHGCSAIIVPETNRDLAMASQEHLETFCRRRRCFDTDDAAFDAIEQLLAPAIGALGTAWAADIWFHAERDYWMRRNRVARVQKARQDALGLGWANHDHHTYRCRRATFPRVISLFEKLGCTCRERFYAGEEAGWGAQVLEHSEAGIVVFADVDMSPDELTTDFSHDGFATRQELGTVGLWCELHGDSMLEAGMHHLECQFHFDQLRDQLLQDHGIRMMEPFTNFAHLKQQFSEGERWSVSPSRIENLLSSNQINKQQAATFLREGAIGSHLENLERNDGFKGFNQTGISDIIRRTDPRNVRQSAQ